MEIDGTSFAVLFNEVAQAKIRAYRFGRGYVTAFCFCDRAFRLGYLLKGRHIELARPLDHRGAPLFGSGVGVFPVVLLGDESVTANAQARRF